MFECFYWHHEMTADFALELNRVDNVKDCHVSLEYVFPHSPSNKITGILDKFYIILFVIKHSQQTFFIITSLFQSLMRNFEF